MKKCNHINECSCNMKKNTKLEACKKALKKMIKEAKKQHLAETSTTGGVAGYETPYAFVGRNKKLKKKMKNVAQMFGYRLVYPTYWNTNDIDNDSDGDGGDGGGD